ncbi:MAG: hypothetical protein WKF55_08235 [Gemmatimonadaceae bacterium]
MKKTTLLPIFALFIAIPGSAQMSDGGSSLLTKNNLNAPQACDYDRCALRFTLRMGSWRVVQGADDRKVGEFTLFTGTDLSSLMTSVPEAADEARRFKRSHRASSSALWGGAVVSVIGIGISVANHGNNLALGAAVAGVAVSTYGGWRHSKSFDLLSRSIWLYNRSLGR